jgi:hypothetical protein
VEETFEALDVARHDLGEGVHAGLGREEEAEHAADVIRGERDVGARRSGGQALHQPIGGGAQPLMKAWLRN